MGTVIKVDNLGKQYRLGQVGTGTIAHDLNRWWGRLRGKEDVYLKLGDVNDRTIKGSSDLVWAIKDISFEVKQGEVLGIIGKNGAGKSTLLKILSQITSPSVGQIKIKGRIAALLEVGTGFHQELTGRENVFLNGAILGMSKTEIKNKFDEIVSFSGVEKYIDTPVKRYSSGMMVRLGFAVAAHLEPEILIIDEVLAVGDAEFQKKCLGKMKDISGQGRTVLFVSHNMSAVLNLCTRAMILSNGSCIGSGSTSEMINKYLAIGSQLKGQAEDLSAPLPNKKVKIRKVKMLNAKKQMANEFFIDEQIFLNIEMEILIPGKGYNFGFELTHFQYGSVFSSCFLDTKDERNQLWEKGSYSFTIQFPSNILRTGDYYINVNSAIPAVELLDTFTHELTFRLIDLESNMAKTIEGRRGAVLPILQWSENRV